MSRELKVHSEDLTPEVAWLAKMPTGPAPVTALIQVTAMLGVLQLRRTNLDQFQESVIPVEGTAQATIFVDAGKLQAGLKSVAGPLVLTVNDDELVIKSEVNTTRLRGADIEWPIWPEFESTADRAVVGAPQLARVLTSVGTDDSIPELMSVVFDEGAMVTTDRFRLSRVTYEPSEFTAMAPSTALKAMVGTGGVVYVDPGLVGTAKWIELSSGGRTVLAPMPERDAFKWKHLIPADPAVQVALQRRDLVSAVGGDEVTIVVNAESVTVIAQGEGIETERIIKPLRMVEYRTSEPLTLKLRSKYLIEALKGIPSGVVLLKGESGRKPVILQDASEIDLHLIMPIREAS